MSKLKSLTTLMLILILAGTSCTVNSQNDTTIVPESYIAYHVDEPIIIDGIGDDLSWDKVPWSNSFIDIEGVKKPTYDTKVKMLWDENYFYILAQLEEPHVWATLKQKDTVIFYNNDFEVFIDPDGDSHNYYELEMNALNTTWDLFVAKPFRELKAPKLHDWNIIGLKSAVKIHGTLNNPNDTDKGWVIELALPWRAFRTSYYRVDVPKDQFWRVDFSRVNWEHDVIDGKYFRKKDPQSGKYLHEFNWVWSPTGVINMHEPEKWGYVFFSSKEAGSEDQFTIPQDDKIKWELFKLYRAQKKYYSKNNAWATTIEDLSIGTLIVEGQTIQPNIENHLTGWNITVSSPFTNKLLIIKEDGEFISK
jgi:hypothetical protein